MPTDAPTTEAPAHDLARECLYRALAAAVAGPYGSGWGRLLDAGNLALMRDAAACLGPDGGPDPFGIDALAERLLATPEDLRAEYDGVFGLVAPKECPPYETEYYPTAETFARSQQLADIAGFYRAFGIRPSRAAPERPDHLALELEFMAVVLMKRRLAGAGGDGPGGDRGALDVCERAQRAFFRDHLVWWVPAFAVGLARKARGGYPGALARVLAAWIPAEGRRLGVAAVLRPVRPGRIEPPEEQPGCAGCPTQR